MLIKCKQNNNGISLCTHQHKEKMTCHYLPKCLKLCPGHSQLYTLATVNTRAEIIQGILLGRLDSVEWNGGLEWWNGME